VLDSTHPIFVYKKEKEKKIMMVMIDYDHHLSRKREAWNKSLRG